MNIKEHITIYHPDQKVCELVSKLTGFKTKQASIADATENCIVSAGNCFGTMDGGSDLALMQKFPGLQARVMEAVEPFNPLGNPEIIWLERIGDTYGIYHDKFLVHIPTMPTPHIKIPISIIYVCYLNLFMMFWRRVFTDIAMPMFGTGWGGHSYEDSCKVMNEAFELANKINGFVA